MPIYPYRCPECGKEEDRLVSFEDRDKQVCCNRLMTRLPALPSPAQWKTSCDTASGGKATK